jgi:hypothetical protein
MPKVFGEKLYSSRGGGGERKRQRLKRELMKCNLFLLKSGRGERCVHWGGGRAWRYRGTADEFCNAAQFFNMHLHRLANSFCVVLCVSAS